MRDAVDEMVARVSGSVGSRAYDDTVDTTGWLNPPPPRETWMDLQGEVVALAGTTHTEDRVRLASALLDAVLLQDIGSSRNVLDADAFALIVDAAPEALDAILVPDHAYGSARYLYWHLWSLPGPAGARWMAQLAEAGLLTHAPLTEIANGNARMFPDSDWPDRLDALARCRTEAALQLLAGLLATGPPSHAGPALTRCALAHSSNKRDWLFRQVADWLRAHRTGGVEGDVELVDWEAHRERPELFRWLLELSGDAGQRAPLVEAAVSAGRIPPDAGGWLAAHLDRPGWADGEALWEVTEAVDVGEADLPDGRLTGGDPFWTGGEEGLPWVVEVPPGRYPVRVVVAEHPLEGRQCAALHLVVDPDAEVAGWSLQRASYDRDGYTSEVGAAGFGSAGAYDSRRILTTHPEFATYTRPAWATVDAQEAGTLVLCSVGPQHQECRTWVAAATDGTPAAVVTDLGLVQLDPCEDPALPW